MSYSETLFATFSLGYEPTAQQKKVVAELNTLLEPMGCNVKVECDALNRYFLDIRVDPDQAAAHRSRGAGRKRSNVYSKRGISPTVGEVRAMLASKTADQVAAELGISRSTLFRRLKDSYGDKSYF